MIKFDYNFSYIFYLIFILQFFIFNQLFNLLINDIFVLFYLNLLWIIISLLLNLLGLLLNDFDQEIRYVRLIRLSFLLIRVFRVRIICGLVLSLSFFSRIIVM
jgi:hypothetical protein